MNVPRPLVLLILDGWGQNPSAEGNAVESADTPNMDRFWRQYPHATLGCAGLSVGLPEGQMGNSEVGHLNLGAGRVVYQDITRIDLAIKDGSIFKNRILLEACANVRAQGGALHLMGLVSDGGVHSHLRHLYALLEMVKQEGVSRVYIHAFLDGRDTPPRSADRYLEALQARLDELQTGKIASLIGRYYAMDRDNRWERTKIAYDALVYRQGIEAISPQQAIADAYEAGQNDEFVMPRIIGGNEGAIKDPDSVIFFNFRSDRPRQLARAFIETDFHGFDRGNTAPLPYFVCMTQYDESFLTPVAFPAQKLDNILADILAANGTKQLRIAETEKYAHVTFFFNGGEEDVRAGEDRVLIPSPKVATYDLQPEMSAYEVAERTVAEIESAKYDVIISNYANADMVGHSGIWDAAIAAVEAVDACAGKVVQAATNAGGEVLVTADHGNADIMRHHGEVVTAHTTNRVPLIYLSNRHVALREDGVLADIAPTMLEILGIAKPAEMTGKSLLVRQSGRAAERQ